MKSRSLYIGTYALLIASLLMGCNKKDEAKVDNNKEKVPVIRIACGGYSKMQEDIEAVNQELGKISEEKAGVRIELVPIIKKNINMVLNDTENPIDIVSIWDSNYKSQLKSLLPLDYLIQQYGKDIVTIMGEDMIALGKYQGKSYGIPKPMQDIYSSGVVVLTEYINKYHIDVKKIKSMADFESVLEIIKNNEPTLIPFVPERTGLEVIKREVIGDVLAENIAMVYYKDASLNVVNYYETPEYEKRVKMVRDWYLKGYIMEDILTNMEGGLGTVTSGMAFSTEFVVRPDEEQFTLKKYGDEITVINFSERPYLSTSSDTALFWSISKKCKNPQAAMKALNLLYADTDIINLVLYGMEGVHYVETEDGHITFPKDITSETTGYYNTGKWRYNANVGKVWEGVSLDIYNIMKDYNASAIVSPAYGFEFNDENLSMDIADIEKVIDDYAVKLGCGVLEVETALPEFQSALKAAGSDRLIEVVQKQVDEWKVKKDK